MATSPLSKMIHLLYLLPFYPCFLPTEIVLQLFSSGAAGKVQESGIRAAANNGSSLVMPASVRVETGDMFRCYTQARVNLNQHVLSQGF